MNRVEIALDVAGVTVEITVQLEGGDRDVALWALDDVAARVRAALNAETGK